MTEQNLLIENNRILHIAVPTPLRRLFDYLPSQDIDCSKLKVGMRIKIPFQRRELIGIYMGESDQSEVPKHKLKPILEIIDTEPVIPNDIMQLCLWAADYYHYSIGEILAGALPAWLRQGRPPEIARAKPLPVTENVVAPLVLNAAQEVAVTTINHAANSFQVFLVDGVTGSGKTEVYLQAIAETLARDQQALVLVPEIGLTPQTIQRFRERFAVPMVTIHSSMTEKQRLHAWLCAKSGEAKIVIGTRSAIFTPFANLGLLIIDEEHDLSFKQQDSFRYHARDIAIMRAHFNKFPIVLGSATPSLESLHNAKQARYQYLLLPERAGIAKLPEFQILDIRNQQLELGLSPALLTEMKQHLAAGDQVMLFLNRRGFAPILMCHSCGWMAKCKRCNMRMTYHKKKNRLHCHHCDSQKGIPSQCEACNQKDLQAIGQGTERLEDALEKYFAEYSIARIDRDSTRLKGSMEEVLDRIQRGEHQILIGTQMLAKGHHFPNVTLVAIVDADGGFFSADFRALERMGQLLLQVSGRAGRDEKPGKVLIQTRQPDHPLLHQLVRESYQKFAQTILSEREQTSLPPYTFFALFRAEAYDDQHALDFLHQVKNLIKEKTIQVMGPMFAPMPMRAGRHRAQLILQATQRPLLQRLLRNLLPLVEEVPMKQRVRWSLDVDPLELT